MKVQKSSAVEGIAAGIIVAAALQIWALIAWNWFISPVFHAPTLSLQEATGLLFCLLPFPAAWWLFKEVQPKS
jgi:hypothetical protein